MYFGEAQDAMRNGKKVARQTWFGKKMFVYLTNGRFIPAKDWTGPAECLGLDGVKISSHMDLCMPNGYVCIGWNPTQIDMMADDWEVVG